MVYMKDTIIPQGTKVRIVANAFDSPEAEFVFEGKTGILAHDYHVEEDMFADVRVEGKSGTWCMFRKEFVIV